MVRIKLYKEGINKLKEKEKGLKKEVKSLLEAGYKLRQEEINLENEEKNKSKLLQIVRRQKDKYKEQLESLKKAVLSQGEGEVLGNFGKPFFETKGKLPYPVRGKLIKKFGLDYNEKFRTKHIHKGVFITAAKGTDVVAPFDGRVEFSGHVPGYGLSLLISHGDSYYTLYSYNRKLKVKNKERITRGQKISLSGYSPQHKGNGLYFEIRHYSEALDPEKWLSPRGIDNKIIGASLETNKQ